MANALRGSARQDKRPIELDLINRRQAVRIAGVFFAIEMVLKDVRCRAVECACAAICVPLCDGLQGRSA